MTGSVMDLVVACVTEKKGGNYSQQANLVVTLSRFIASGKCK